MNIRPRVLRDRNFAIYALGNAVSYVGTWAQRIGIGWLSWSLTHQALWVGLISIVQILPLIAFGPIFGTLLDRHDSRRFALAVNLSSAGLAVLLYVVTAAGWMNIDVLLVLALLLGVANSAYQSVRLAMINEVVPPALLAEAISFNSILFNVARAAGPALAGLVIARFGIATAFAVNAVSFVGILWALSAVELRPRSRRKSAGGLFSQLLQGLAYVRGHAAIRQIMVLVLVTQTLGRGLLELLPVFADTTFHRGSLGLAYLTTASGVGAILGSFGVSRFKTVLPTMTRLSAYGVGPLVILFAMSQTYALGLVLCGVLTLGIILCSIGLQVELQSTIDDHFRGRVLGLWTTVNTASPGIGGAAIGLFANWFGLQWVGVATGALCLLLVVLVRPHADRQPGQNLRV